MPANGGGPIPARCAKPLGHQDAIWLQRFARVLSLGSEDSAGRKESGFYRRPDTLAALLVREPGGIADEQQAIPGEIARPAPEQKIGMTEHGRRNVKIQPASRF